MRKEIEFEIDSAAYGSYRPIIVYYDDNNSVFDRAPMSLKSILDQITQSDLTEFTNLVKQSLLEDINNIYGQSLNNAEVAFIKHRINYESFLLMKRSFEEQENI